jgi:glutathionylspermidine synthase
MRKKNFRKILSEIKNFDIKSNLKEENEYDKVYREEMIEDFKFLYNKTKFPYFIISSSFENKIKKATEDINNMFLKALEYILSSEDEMKKFNVNKKFWDIIRNSWKKFPKDYTFSGRLDFGFSSDGEEVKLFEYNTGCCGYLYETSFLQKKLYESYIDSNGFCPGRNLIERMVEVWENLLHLTNSEIIYFVVDKEVDEIRLIEVISKILNKSGIKTKTCLAAEGLYVGDDYYIYDDEKRRVNVIYKTYSWNTVFNKILNNEKNLFVDILTNPNIVVIEPMWRTLLGNKAMLPIVYKLFPDSPYLLPTTFDPSDEIFKDEDEIVEKSLIGRGSYDVRIVDKKEVRAFDNCIYQKKYETFSDEGYFYVMGSWIVGNEYGGLIIRHSKDIITSFNTTFTPVRVYDDINFE